MDDRTSCTRLDRTNGYDDGRDYMRVKKSKLANQNDEIRDALRKRNASHRSDLFKGVSINVNGRTQPTADELKRLILLHGGDYHPYYRYQTTKYMIATNLSTARMKTLRPDDRIVRPQWITDSIQVNCLLPYEDYQLFFDEPRGKTGSVLAIDEHSNSSMKIGLPRSGSSSDQLVPVAESYSKSYRNKPKGKKKEPPRKETKNMDIREMFSKAQKKKSEPEGGSSPEVIY